VINFVHTTMLFDAANITLDLSEQLSFYAFYLLLLSQDGSCVLSVSVHSHRIQYLIDPQIGAATDQDSGDVVLLPSYSSPPNRHAFIHGVYDLARLFGDAG